MRPRVLGGTYSASRSVPVVTVLARFTLSAEDFALGQVLAGTNAEISLTQVVPVEAALVPYFWVADGHDRDAFERGVRADPRVETLKRLDGRVERTLYRIRWSNGTDGLFHALADHEVLVEGAQCRRGTWTIRVRAVDRAALKTFVEDCREEDISLEIGQVVDNPSDPDTPLGLTEKQYEALQLAHAQGYFEIPRRVNQGDLADQVGITRQAFARRLKRALQTVIATLLAEAAAGTEAPPPRTD